MIYEHDYPNSPYKWVTFNLETHKMPEPKYDLNQLWPYKGFVKPIHLLATPHLQNISDLFKDEERFIFDSNGKPRTIEETTQLRCRVGLVNKILNERPTNRILKPLNPTEREITSTISNVISHLQTITRLLINLQRQYD